jgi:hypothetical protein
MKAKNREQYVQTWNAHIAELIHPFMDSDTPIDEWFQTKAELEAVVETAAVKLFPDEPEINCGACTVAIGAHLMNEHCRYGKK